MGDYETWWFDPNAIQAHIRDVVWDEELGMWITGTQFARKKFSDMSRKPQDGGTRNVNPPELNKPLTIKRATVIDRLNEVLGEEREKRAAEAAKVAEARDAFEVFVGEHADEVANFLRNYWGFGPNQWTAALEAITKDFENGRYKTVEQQPSEKENRLEKFVRVLSMADDTTIEITPVEPIYGLL